jgi:hypothetical protein
MAPRNARYIPAGALTIAKQDLYLRSDLWEHPDLQEWRSLVSCSEELVEVGATCLPLPTDIQEVILKAPSMSPCAKLLKARWVKLEFRISAKSVGILRVYLLPDDVDRRAVDRSNPYLLKQRHSILLSLNYSRDLWNGDSVGSILSSPLPVSVSETTEDTSLLQLFNNIPSPKPTVDGIDEPHAQEAMLGLLKSCIPGLLTNLYPYQRRSAACMLQKEMQPGQVLDPRLLHVQDQNGNGWYVDMVAGTVLLEPRFYDAIPGGILAEEMGSGKTIICLSLILATRNLPSKAPEWHGPGELPIRPRVASLADMAASCINNNAVPWKPYFDSPMGSEGNEYVNCKKALERNPGYYLLPPPEPRRVGRHPVLYQQAPTKIHLSSASLVVVPSNLVSQWNEEIQKHTTGLKVLTLTHNDTIPPLPTLIDLDIILFSQSRFETLSVSFDGDIPNELELLHFQRCIVDEGHKLGNAKIGNRSNLLTRLDRLRFSSRWIVTGTPSHGLFGVGSRDQGHTSIANGTSAEAISKEADLNRSSTDMEKRDLERIGSMAALYLKARPWANTAAESGDTPADWGTYLLLPKHSPKGRGRWDCLKSTLNSLIIRHRLDDIGNLLPPVDEKITVLKGSYQDQLSMNIFSMMIIFNSVQSQRTDMDYFFHSKQRKSLLQIVSNLKQASFFGGSFFTSEEIAKSVVTAEEFLREGKVQISAEDKVLIEEAIKLGHLAVDNTLRRLSNTFHEIPVSMDNFPGTAGHSWSLGGEQQAGTDICTSASLLLALQKLIYGASKEPEKFNALLNGGLAHEGQVERRKLLSSQASNGKSLPGEKQSQTLAGNTKLGNDSPKKSRQHAVNGARKSTQDLDTDSVPTQLESTKITATVSAKMSYLLDSITRHQQEEKILVFYENENIAWYLASMLDVVGLT